MPSIAPAIPLKKAAVPDITPFEMLYPIKVNKNSSGIGNPTIPPAKAIIIPKYP